MCELCDKVEDNQPDLGPDAFLAITNATVGISTTLGTGIRITQERDVSYVGPEGNTNRTEVESIYLSWDQITPFLINCIAIQQQHGKDEEL